jgi:hypothetical protein
MREFRPKICVLLPRGQFAMTIPNCCGPYNPFDISCWICSKFVLLLLFGSREQVNHIAWSHHVAAILSMPSVPVFLLADAQEYGPATSNVCKGHVRPATAIARTLAELTLVSA